MGTKIKTAAMQARVWTTNEVRETEKQCQEAGYTVTKGDYSIEVKDETILVVWCGVWNRGNWIVRMNPDYFEKE